MTPHVPGAVDNIFGPPDLQHPVSAANEVCFLPALNGG